MKEKQMINKERALIRYFESKQIMEELESECSVLEDLKGGIVHGITGDILKKYLKDEYSMASVNEILKTAYENLKKAEIEVVKHHKALEKYGFNFNRKEHELTLPF